MTQALQTALESARPLSDQEKAQLIDLLEEELALLEESEFEHDIAAKTAIREARAEYSRGDFVTIDEYAARQK